MELQRNPSPFRGTAIQLGLGIWGYIVYEPLDTVLSRREGFEIPGTRLFDAHHAGKRNRDQGD